MWGGIYGIFFLVVFIGFIEEGLGFERGIFGKIVFEMRGSEFIG